MFRFDWNIGNNEDKVFYPAWRYLYALSRLVTRVVLQNKHAVFITRLLWNAMIIALGNEKANYDKMYTWNIKH